MWCHSRHGAGGTPHWASCPSPQGLRTEVGTCKIPPDQVASPRSRSWAPVWDSTRLYMSLNTESEDTSCCTGNQAQGTRHSRQQNETRLLLRRSVGELQQRRPPTPHRPPRWGGELEEPPPPRDPGQSWGHVPAPLKRASVGTWKLSGWALVQRGSGGVVGQGSQACRSPAV